MSRHKWNNRHENSRVYSFCERCGCETRKITTVGKKELKLAQRELDSSTPCIGYEDRGKRIRMRSPKPRPESRAQMRLAL